MQVPELELYRSIAGNAPAMLWSSGLEGGCNYVNAAWLAFTGRTLDDELGDGWQASLHPEDRERHVTLYLHHFTLRKAFESRCRLRRRDGEYRSVLFQSTPRVNAEGAFSGFVCSVLDVDERAHGETLAESVVFDSLLDHVCVAGFDGYWKQLNAAWSRTLGFSREELLATPTIDLVHPDDRAATLAARAGLHQGDALLSLTNRYRKKDGTYCWLEWKSVADAQRKQVYAVARDVTQEQEVRQALRERTESLKATLNSIADGVITTSATALVTLLNPVAEALTGWTFAEAVGRPLTEVFAIISADTHAQASLPLERTLQEGLVSESTEHTLLVAKNGKELPIAFSRAPMRDDAGHIAGSVIVFRDMTTEKQARLEQERLQQQLIFAGRMASVGTLAAGVAHEINNPLAYVIANLDMILEDLGATHSGAQSPNINEWLDMAEQARGGADRIRKIVRGLKTFSRDGEEHREVIDIRPVLEMSVDMAFNEIRHRARLVTDYGVTPLVRADESRLGQVFINLLVNAAQAVHADGREVSQIEVITATGASGEAIVEVRDTGPGIPSPLLQRIFDPFFTTKPVGVGTGLGLAICHNIVSGMKGEITARNRETGGAIFRVTLPAATGPLSHPYSATKVELRRPLARRASILIVDDEAGVGAALTRILREHEVTCVTSAKEALGLIDAGRAFDLIISDLMMPEMSGIELYDEVERRGAQLTERMVFITGGAFSAAANEFLGQVSNERFEKPFDPVALRALVGRFVR